MNILFLDPIKLTNKDGGGIHRMELIKNFCVLNNDVYIFLKGKHDLDFDYILNLPTINVYHIGNNRIYSLILYSYYLSILSLKNHIDMFYSRNVFYSFPGLIISKMKKTKMFFEKNGIIADEGPSFSSNNGKNRFKKRLYTDILYLIEMMELFLLKYCDNIIAVTPLLKEYLLKNGIDHRKVHVIENGANTDLFKPIAKSEACKRLNLSDDKKYVCFVGYLAPWQGIKSLIQAIPLIIKEMPIYFLIVGTGPLYNELNDLSIELSVDEYVVFTNLVPYENVPLYINSSDVCVAPFIKARNERIGLSPLKIYEYMSCNKPVICSRIPNLEFIEEQNAGILFEPENIYNLAESIMSFFNERQNYDNLSSREYILKNNSWMEISKRIMMILVNS
jgi:glycosyltransferase involved in cell wall biosynthesis